VTISDSDSNTMIQPYGRGVYQIWGTPVIPREKKLAMYNLNQHDKDILRRLAERLVAIADSPLNKERKALWYKLDAGIPERPMILAEALPIMDKNPPVSRASLECENRWVRIIEMGMREQIYQFDILRDDHVVEPLWNVAWHIQVSDYGVQTIEHLGENYGGLGGRKWDAPIKDLNKDLGKLHPSTYSVDRETTFAEKECLEKAFGDIIPVRIRGIHWMTMGLTFDAFLLIGLQSFMTNMLINPDGIHRLMSFLHDDHLALCSWTEKEGLLTLNNENEYLGSGSISYTHDLPASNKKPGEPVKLKDLWVLIESQETVGVGPKQFEELIFPYQRSIAEKFGKVYYGCCEPIDSRWHIIKQLPNLARASISPWADQEMLSKAIGNRIVYSRKPNPALVSTEKFNEDEIRADIRKTLALTRNCCVELVMKDVHTLNEEPWRLPRWVEITREEVEKSS
jgi:hypothetical protein